MPPAMLQQQQQPPPMQNYQQQYPIYASGVTQQQQLSQMVHPQQNGAPIYVPSSISIQNSLNNAATAIKPAPVPTAIIPPTQNNTYGHGMMQQQIPTPPVQQIPQAPQYMPTLQQQISVPGAPAPRELLLTFSLSILLIFFSLK
jgi:hypothetical protein